MNSSAARADCSWLVYTNSRADYRVVARQGAASPAVDEWIARLAKLVDPAIKPGFETLVGVAVSPSRDSSGQRPLLAFRVFDAGTFLARPHTLAIVAVEISSAHLHEDSIAALLASLPTPRPDSQEYDFPPTPLKADFSRQPAALAALDAWQRGNRFENSNLPVAFATPPELLPDLRTLSSAVNRALNGRLGERRNADSRGKWTGSWKRAAALLLGAAAIAGAVALFRMLRDQPANDGLVPDAHQRTSDSPATASREQLLATLAKVHIDLPGDSSRDQIVRATQAAAADAERRMQTLHDELAESPAHSSQRADILQRHLRRWNIGLDVSAPTVIGPSEMLRAQAALLQYRSADEELSLLAKRSPTSAEFADEVDRLILRLAAPQGN